MPFPSSPIAAVFPSSNKVGVSGTISFPASLRGAGGITVAKANGVWTVKPQLGDLALLTPTDFANTELWGRDAISDQMVRIRVGDMPATSQKLGAITAVIMSTGGAIPTGVALDLEVPFTCTIQQVNMYADPAGSVQVDIWKDTFVNFPPTVADSITGTAKPTITSSNKSQNSALAAGGWIVNLIAGDVLRYNVVSCLTINKLTLVLDVLKA